MKFLLFCRRCISRQVVHYFGENLMPIKVYLTYWTIYFLHFLNFPMPLIGMQMFDQFFLHNHYANFQSIFNFFKNCLILCLYQDMLSLCSKIYVLVLSKYRSMFVTTCILLVNYNVCTRTWVLVLKSSFHYVI